MGTGPRQCQVALATGTAAVCPSCSGPVNGRFRDCTGGPRPRDTAGTGAGKSSSTVVASPWGRGAPRSPWRCGGVSDPLSCPLWGSDDSEDSQELKSLPIWVTIPRPCCSPMKQTGKGEHFQNERTELVCFKMFVPFLYQLPLWVLMTLEREGMGAAAWPQRVSSGVRHGGRCPLCAACASPARTRPSWLLSADPSARASPAPHIQGAGGLEQPRSCHS